MPTILSTEVSHSRHCVKSSRHGPGLPRLTRLSDSQARRAEGVEAVVVEGDIARLASFLEGASSKNRGPLDKVAFALREVGLKGLGEFAVGELCDSPKEARAIVAKLTRDGVAIAQAVNGSIGRAWMRFAKRSSPIFTQNRSSTIAELERSLRSRTQASHPASRAVRSRRDHDSKRRRPFSRAKGVRLAPDSTTRLSSDFLKRRGLDTLYSPPPRAQIRRSVAVIARLGCDDVDRRDGRLGR